MQSDDAGRPLGEQFQALRRRAIFPMVIIPLALLVSVYMAFALTPMYRSSGTIMLEQSTIPTEIVQSTVGTYADQQIEIVRRRVLTNEVLKELVAEVDPYPDSGLSADAKADLVSENTEIERVDPVTLKTLEESTAFSIHYHNPDPRIARNVASRLVDLFLTYNQRTRTERAQETYEFLLAKSDGLREDMREMEAQLAVFKTKYGDALPEAQGRNLVALDQARRDLDGYERQMRMAMEQQSMLRLQLQSTAPSLTAAVSDWRTELARLRGELALAQQRYTPEHPDVKRLQRAIEELAATGNASTGAGGAGTPDNPEYLRMQSQLESVNREIAALQANASQARAQIGRYSGSLRMAPEVERDYARLARDYTIAQDQFREIQGKLSDASLAETLESEQIGERFALIRSPSTPGKPFRPNRIGIILLGLVLGSGIAIALVALAESSDPTVRGSHDIRDLTSLPIISAVPIMRTARDRRVRALAWGSASIVVVFAVAIVAFTVLSAVKPT